MGCVLGIAATLAGDAVAIFPTADVLPANHLKFYLHFAQPMRPGVFLDHCALLDARGQPVPEPFRETELWSDDRQRLTLWLHPGRQKTGVNLNVELGPVLEPERRYTLRISGGWPTESGAPLGASLEKHFRTSARQSAQLDPADWHIAAPKVGTRDPLEVRFPAPLDHALLSRCLSVETTAGQSVAGQFAIGSQERSWRFTPSRAWTDSPHRIAVETVLEDLAGNSLARPFEVDLRAPPPRSVPQKIALDFRPRL